MRLLFWNIENFSRRKIDDTRTNTRQSGSTLTSRAASLQRLAYVMAHVATGADIFVVVELETPGGVRGSLAGGNALPACQALLNALRNANADWMLVPPLKVGTKESVAVFYRSTRLVFTGPFVWGGNVAVDPNGNAAQAYANLNWPITGNRNVPNGALYNVGTAEKRCAARTSFTRAQGLANAGAAYDFGALRVPYMTTFAELDANNAVARNLTIFAVHSPASYDGSRNFLNTVLPGVAQIVGAIGADEVRVVPGDFNVNLIHSGDPNVDPAANTYNTIYNSLPNYATALIPAVAARNNPPNPPRGYRGYFATHMRGKKTARFLSTNTVPQYFPGYDYIGAETGNYFAIDNIFVRYGNNVNPPNPNNFTVLNGCVGSAFVLVQPVPGGAPIGAVNLASFMPNLVVANPAATWSVGQNTRLSSGWSNFGRIRSTSDHMALVMDI